MKRTHFGQHGDDCFGCRLQSLNFGYTYGRESFHGDTVRERQQEIVKRSAENGYKVEPVGQRWV